MYAIRSYYAVAHVVALEPGSDLACRVVGAAFGLRAMRPQFRPVARVVAPAREHGLDRSVNEQVGIAPDRRSEVGVVLVGEPEMADVLRAVDRLLQGARITSYNVCYTKLLRVRTEADNRGIRRMIPRAPVPARFP